VHDKADLTLTPSLDAVEMLKDSGFKNVHLLGRGVDAKIFFPKHRSNKLRESWGADPEAPVAILVGRVALEKNLDFALSELLKMKEDQYSSLQIVVVGDGPARKKLSDKYSDVHS